LLREIGTSWLHGLILNGATLSDLPVVLNYPASNDHLVLSGSVKSTSATSIEKFCRAGPQAQSVALERGMASSISFPDAPKKM
jgi:hypothetical protein